MSRPLPRYRPDTDPYKLERIIDENTTEPTITTKATLPGDTRRLRGIPVVGGTTGTSPGTDPHAALEAKERTARRFKHKRIATA